MEWRYQQQGFVTVYGETFFMLYDAQTFCIELCRKGLEGLCACMYGNYHTFIPKKPLAVSESLSGLRKNIL